MKATIEKKKLMQSLSHLHGVVEKRNTIPILANVLIEAKENTLTLAVDASKKVLKNIDDSCFGIEFLFTKIADAASLKIGIHTLSFLSMCFV